MTDLPKLFLPTIPVYFGLGGVQRLVYVYVAFVSSLLFVIYFIVFLPATTIKSLTKLKIKPFQNFKSNTVYPY